MRKLGFVLATLAVLTLSTAVHADDAKKTDADKKEACALLGNCGEEMARQARTVMDDCKAMMAKAQELMDKGKRIRGQGLLWQDKEMIADGTSLYDQGEKMYAEAKKMSQACAQLIKNGEKLQKKYPHQETPASKESKPHDQY